MSNARPTSLGLTLPLRIVAPEEAVKVMDADGQCAAYAHMHTCTERDRRLQTKRLSPHEGVEAAKVIARALTVELERRNSGLARAAADLLRGVDAATEV